MSTEKPSTEKPSTEKLTGQQVVDARLDGWTLLAEGLQTRIRTPDYATGLRLVASIGAAAEELNHHPDLDLRYGHLDVRLSSHDVGGVTTRDLTLARRINDLARQAGARLECDSVARLELALDSPDFAAVMPFWGAVLAMDPQTDRGAADELRDPSGVMPMMWFQESGAEEPRQRWHPDVWVDPDQVQPRIDAALAAGGSLVSDAQAPSYWVLADPEGNRVCLCTWQERG